MSKTLGVHYTVIPVVIIVCCGTVLAVVLAAWTSQSSRKLSDTKFRLQADSHATLIVAQFEGYVSAAKTLAVHIAQNYETCGISRTQFAEAADPLLESFQANAFGYAKEVKDEERAEQERTTTEYWQQQLNTTKTYFFTGLTSVDCPGGVPQCFLGERRGNETVYQPVTFLHPEAGNLGAINFDLLSRNGTAEIFAFARETQSIVASPPTLLVQDAVAYSYSIILYGPVRNNNDFVSAIVRVQTLLNLVAATAEEGTKLYLYDVSDRSDIRFMGGVVREGDSISSLPAIDLPHAEVGLFTEHAFNVTQREYVFITVSANPEVDNVSAILFASLTILFALVSGGLYIAVSVSRYTRIKAEVQAATLKAQRDSEKAMTEFLLHEIRNPLTVALGAIDSKMDTDGDDKMVLTSLSYINNLLDNILNISQFEANFGAVPLHKELKRLKEDVIQPVVDMLETGSEISVRCECEENLWVVVDGLRLQQVLMNLVKNSIKFVQEGYVKISAFRDKSNKEIVVLQTEDSGPGIPESDIDKLFTKHETLSRITGQGNGIGLYLCKLLVSAMQGTITLDRKYTSGIAGRPGCRFVVRLPLPDESSSPAVKSLLVSPSPESTIPAPIFSMPYRVLIVDDEAMVRMITKRQLKRLAPNWEYIEAESGCQALDIAKKEAIDVVFVDHFMPGDPGWNGEETITYLRAEKFSGIIIGVSANEKEQDHVAAGANTFLQKPISTDKLKKALVSTIEKNAKTKQAKTSNDIIEKR